MPISDEVIELAPVNKTKKTLIILFVVLGVFVALAVTFLVMYLLKPNVEENPVIVNAVTVQNSDMFTITENDAQVKYASVGNEYRVYANISVEKGDPNITWEVLPAGAVHINEQSDVPTVDEATGEYKGAFIAFTPNNGYNNTDVTIKARSAADMSKSAEITFKIVLQGAASIRPNQFYPQGESANALAVENDTVSIPFYTGNDLNNKRYVFTFDQLGRYNESTGEYAPISIVGTGESASNMVEVTSSNTAAVAVSNPSPGAFYFRAVSASRGPAVITIRANINNESAEVVEKQITVNVVSNTTLGYIEDVYFFNQAVVNGEFIESVVANCFTAGKLDNNKLDDLVKTHDGLVKNPREFTLPYDVSGTYDNIFSHILVSPISIQYADGEFKEDWFKKITVASSESGILRVISANDGGVSLRASGLASSAEGAATCTLTFTDNTVGSIRARNSVAVRVVAQNEGGTVSAKVGNTPVEEGTRVDVAPNVTGTMTVTYKIKMPGNTDLASLLNKDYLTKQFMLDYNAEALEVTIDGNSGIIAPRTVQTLATDSITFRRTGGTDSGSIADFDGVVVFNVKVKSSAQGGEYPITFTKIGTSRTGQSDWDGVDKGDRTWSKSMTFNVTRRATEAFFISSDEANAIVTGNGSRQGRFVLDENDHSIAHIYVQNQREGTAFGTLFNVRSLVATDANDFSTKVSVHNYDANTFTLTRSNATNPNDTLTFKGNLTPSTSQSTEANISVYDVAGVPVGEGLTVYIHVFDAVISFKPVDEKSATYSPDSAGLSNGNIQIRRSEINVKRVINEDFTAYTVTTDNIDLLYIDKETNEYVPLSKSLNGASISFSHAGTELFMFSTSTERLTPKVDLFAYSYYTGIDFTNLTFEVSLSASEYYVGSVQPKGAISCKFIRKADGVAVFKETGWREGDRLTLVGNNIDYSVNQGETGKLYLSADVKVKDPRNPDAADEWVVANRLSSVCAERPTVTLDSSLVPSVSTGDEVAPNSGKYYWVEFIAPRVSGSGMTAQYTLNIVAGDDIRPSISLTVQNFARTISEICFYIDEGGGELDDILMFGGFINGDLYTRVVYVKIGYVAASESYMYYESATLTLPYYLSVITSDEIVKIDNPNPNASTRVYRITPSKDDVKTFNGYKWFECELSLDIDSSEHSGDSITVEQMYGGDTPASDSAEVCVATGLSGVEMSADGVTASDITVNFDLANATDAASRTFAVKYNTVSATARANVKYDNSNVDKLAISVPTSVNGLTINADGLRASEPTFTVAVDLSVLKAPATHTFSLTFTDTVNEANANNVFTVNFTVNVNIDIFELGFEGGNAYTVEVNGGGGDATPVEIQLKFNGGNANIQPVEAKKALVIPSLWVKNGNSYEIYSGNMRIEKEDGKYKLYVPNSVEIGTNFYVRAYYSESVVAYKHISIATTSHRIQWAESGNVALTAGAADIVVTQSGQKFKLAVDIINDGTKLPVEGQKTNLSYGIYTDKTYNTPATDVTIDADGNISVVNPQAASGTVYYRASYRDADGTGNYYYLYADINYSLQVTSVELDLDSTVIDNDTITLYYKDRANYTSLDLKNSITVANALGIDYGAGELAITMESSSSNVGVSGMKLIPTSETDDVGVIVTVTAKFGKTESLSKQYNVIVKKLGALELFDGNSDECAIDVIANTDVTVTPSYNAAYRGLDATYALPAVSGLTVSGDGDVKTISLTSRQNATIGTSYTLTATVTYDLKSADCGLEIVGGLSSSVVFSVSIVGDYVPEFDLVYGTNSVVPTYDVSEDNKHIVSTANSYRVNITNGGAHGYTDPAYSAAPDKEIVSISAFAGTTANVTLENNASGGFKITVLATVYGKTFTAYKNYYFTYGVDATAELLMRAPGETDYTKFTSNTQAIDFAGATPYMFKYEISGLDTSVVSVSDVDIVVNGAVTVSEIKRGTNSYYVEITADKPATLSVGGSVTVVNRTVYFAQQTVSLTAAEPEFTLTAPDTVVAGGTAKFAVGKTAGQGNFSVKFEIESGNGATINATSGDLTADKNITLDRSVTVKATVTMNSGAYATEQYVYRKTITVIGVPLPTVGWTAERVYVNAGNSYTLSDWYKANNVVTHSGGSYTYSLTVNATDSAVGLTKTTDYNVGGGKLEIKDTLKTRAGGKITLTLSAKINGTGINGGASATVNIAEIEVIINPQAQAVSNVIVSNGKGSYDISGVAKPYTATDGYFVSADDNYKLVGLELLNDADKTDFAVSGSILTLKNNIATERNIGLRATIELIDGNYANARLVCETAVTVVIPAISSAGSVLWNGGTNSYDAVSAIAPRLSIGEITADNPVIAIEVTAIDNGEYISIVNNGSISPVITVDKDFNTAVGTTGANKSINVAYRIALKNGNAYYITETLSIACVNVELEAYENVVDENHKLDASAAISKESGESFVMVFTANNGFTPAVTDVLITVGDSATSEMTARFGGDRIMFSVADISESKLFKIVVTVKVGGSSVVTEYTVNVAAEFTSAAYTANNSDNTDFATGESGTVNSVWSKNGSHNYNYASSVTISAQSDLSNYISSISLKSSDGTQTYKTEYSVSGRSLEIYFDSYYSRKNLYNNGFILSFEFKTSSAVDRVNIAAELLTYSSAYGGRSQSVTVQYAFRVVGDMTVTLDVNADGDNVTGVGESVVRKYKAQYNIGTPVRSGYRFDGWYTRPEGGNKVNDADTVTSTINHTLYAHWTANEYTVTFNANGGSVSQTSKAIRFGDTYGRLPVPTREGYAFAGWYTQETGGTQVDSADVMNIADNSTLYAHWTANSITVTFDPNGGNLLDGYTLTKNVTVGGTYGELPTPTRSGYTFGGWYTQATAGTEVENATVVTATSAHTLYAHWTATDINVALNVNGGDALTEGADSKQVTFGAAYGSLPTPTRSGYTFIGWYTQAEDGIKVESTTTVTTATAHTLYAHWRLNSYTITLDANGGTISGLATLETTVNHGDSYALHTNIVPTRTGYTFAGWYTQADGGEQKASAITAEGDTILYAHWTANEYNVTFDVNGGDALNESENSKQITFGTVYGAIPNPTREGFNFDGWYTQAEGGELVESTDIVAIAADHTLYARWTEL